jgi:hypothetical protein
MSWSCCTCQSVRQKPQNRLPAGWKRREEQVYCETCWSKEYVMRTITFPVSSPVDCDWDELCMALREMWAATTQASNWMMTELYARDVRRNGEEKMPPMARVYLYPETRARFPQLPSQTCASLEKAAQKKYRAVRRKLIWQCAVSLPTCRYPTPFPIPNQGWSVEIKEERIVVSVPIGEKRYKVQLCGGPGFHRQREAVNKIISGAAVQGELALYEQGKYIMCKIVAWLPRPEPEVILTWPRDTGQPVRQIERAGILMARTGPEGLLVALNGKDEKLWQYHGDHIVRWSAEHRNQLRRWADDTKAEERPVPSFAVRRQNAAAKYRHRMQTAVKEVARMLVSYAGRRKFASIRYDDDDTSYCEGFPWFALRERIKVNCDELGIDFVHHANGGGGVGSTAAARSGSNTMN